MMNKDDKKRLNEYALIRQYSVLLAEAIGILTEKGIGKNDILEFSEALEVLNRYTEFTESQFIELTNRKCRAFIIVNDYEMEKILEANKVDK